MIGAPWSDKEDARVRELWMAGRSDKEIGHALGRTWQSVKWRRLEKRWVADRSSARETSNADREPMACGDENAFRSSTKVATQMLLERIAEHHPNYRFVARVAA